MKNLQPVLWLSILISLSLGYAYPHSPLQERLHRANSKPARWNQRATRRPFYSRQQSNFAEAIHDSKSDEDHHYIIPDHLAKRSREEWYNLDYPEETGKDLKETLAGEDKNIIVTVWYENYQNEWAQNMVNQNIQGTLWKCICENHPDIIYKEADISHYNINAYTYIDVAKQLKIELGELYDGPTVVIMNDQSGKTFRTEEGPDKLLRAVEQYIRNWEKELYGVESPAWDFHDQVLADNHYEHYDPDEFLPMFNPKKYEKNQDKKDVIAPSKYSLLEPDKAFS